MTLPGHWPKSDPPRNNFPTAVAACLVLLTGCASQGPLRPPSLHLPAPVRGLAAERIGDGVDLQWTSPTRTADGLSLIGKHVPVPIRAEICRVGTPASSCQSVGRLPVTSGEKVYFHDQLPTPLTLGPLRSLNYRVCILNGVGRGGTCGTAEALAGAAPAAMQRVEAGLVQNGVLIRWLPVAKPDKERVLLRVTRAPAGLTADTTTPDATTQTKAKQDSVLLATESEGLDPGGALDTGAKPGVAQHYSIARTRTAHLGEQDLVISGQPATVTVAADAKLPPPAPPANLEAVVNTLEEPEIDLVWQPVDGAAGYLLYRASGADQPVLLTAEPVQGLTYTDKAVKRGVRYRYSIAAVDRDGRPGSPGSEAVEQVPDR